MIYSNTTYDVTGRIIKSYDGSKYWKINNDYFKSPLPINRLGLSSLAWKWFETGLLNNLSMDEIERKAIILEHNAKEQCNKTYNYIS